MDVINDAEGACPVLDWRADGLRLWPLIRIRLFIDLWERAQSAPDARAHTQGVRKLAGYAKRVTSGVLRQITVRLKDPSANDSHRNRADLLLVSDGVSFALVDGRWIERFCDPVVTAARDLGLNILLIRRPPPEPGDRAATTAAALKWVADRL